VSGHTCVASPIDKNELFLFGGVAEPTLDVTGGAGASVTSSSSNNSAKIFSSPSKPKPQSLKEAHAESARLAMLTSASATKASQQQWGQTEQPPQITATNNLWIYKRDKPDNSPDWQLIPPKLQGVSRPSPRIHTAAATLGHMMFLFGGYDPKNGKSFSDIWTLSLKTNKWTLCQAWLPYEVSKHVACAISDTKIVLYTDRGDVLLYDDDLPTPLITTMDVDGEGPVGLSLCASCGIPRTTTTTTDDDDDDDRSSSSAFGGVDDRYSRNGGGEKHQDQDMLIFGGSTGENEGFSSESFRLDTKSWSWSKLVPKSQKRPPPLQAPSVASLGKNQCIMFGGAALNKRDRSFSPSDETWLLTVDGNEANWEQIAVQGGGEGAASPVGRLSASLTATTPEELILHGGYNPTSSKQSHDTQTWMLTKHPIDHAKIAREKRAREQLIKDEQLTESEAAASRVADMIAQAGSGIAFEGTSLGVGGLDHVLEEVKTRIWTPLAAPPKLLKDLGIQPTRGLLFYGGPGCGKTLLASTLGNMLSPFRPITVVAGPEILDKFVGSSEQNLRAIFDSPPDIYEEYKRNETDGGVALGRAAVHVVVMDEFDALARSRGGGGAGSQGDAGVARDSVVNQLLSKMDGVQPLVVPTLVIGLTNKRDLIDPALLRPGRFEVQIEITPPKTIAQRRSIVMVHTKQMFDAGRLQVKDPPPGSAAADQLENAKHLDILTYDELADQLAIYCDGFSGAAIAGITRAAASRALARSVGRLSGDDLVSEDDDASSYSIMDCLVTQDDFYQAINAIRGRSKTSDSVDDVEGGNDRQESSRGGFRSQLRQRIRSWTKKTSSP